MIKKIAFALASTLFLSSCIGYEVTLSDTLSDSEIFITTDIKRRMVDYKDGGGESRFEALQITTELTKALGSDTIYGSVQAANGEELLISIGTTTFKPFQETIKVGSNGADEKTKYYFLADSDNHPEIFTAMDSGTQIDILLTRNSGGALTLSIDPSTLVPPTYDQAILDSFDPATETIEFTGPANRPPVHSQDPIGYVTYPSLGLNETSYTPNQLSAYSTNVDGTYVVNTKEAGSFLLGTPNVNCNDLTALRSVGADVFPAIKNYGPPEYTDIENPDQLINAFAACEPSPFYVVISSFMPFGPSNSYGIISSDFSKTINRQGAMIYSHELVLE